MMDLSIIIVNYNVRHLLENCIESILKASKNYQIEIIVIDNNSFDGSAEFIKSRYSSSRCIRLIESNVNLGFAKANNLAIKQATGEYILILNPDTLLQEETIDKCLNYYKSDEKIGALTCKLILPNGKLDLACRRSFPSTSIAFYRMIGLSKLFPKSKILGRYNLTYLDQDQTYEVEAICGAFMLMRKDLFDRVGGFDEDYFMYGEDLDLCFKIRKAGYKIYYYPETSIIHYKGESTRKSSLSYVNNFYGAMGIFVKKNLHKSFRLINYLIKIMIIYRASVSYFVRFLRAFYPALIDTAMIVGAILISIKMRFEFFPVDAYSVVIVIYTLIWLLSLTLSGSYKRLNIYSFIKPLNGILIGFFINSSFTYFFNEFAFSRAVVIRATAYSYLFIFLWRLIAKLVVYSKQKNLFQLQSNTIVIGKNEESAVFVNKLKTKVDSGYNILGYVSANASDKEGDFIGNTNNLKDLIAINKVKNLIFAKSVLTNQQILDMMWELKNYNLSYKILSSDNEFALGKLALDKIDDVFLMQIEYNINKKFNIFVKRLFDFFVGLVLTVLVYPFVLIYTKLFKVKSNNMKFGSKLLLLPDVLFGTLSFVGRATWDTTSRGRLSLGKRGLTGLVQINYYKKLSEVEIEYYNNYYAKNQSLSLDLEIMIKTISLFIFRNKIIKL